MPVMHQSATGEVLFQLLEKRNAVTFRKKSQDKTVDQPTVIIEPEVLEEA
jgi:hypothetical protein